MQTTFDHKKFPAKQQNSMTFCTSVRARLKAHWFCLCVIITIPWHSNPPSYSPHLRFKLILNTSALTNILHYITDIATLSDFVSRVLGTNILNDMFTILPSILCTKISFLSPCSLALCRIPLSTN